MGTKSLERRSTREPVLFVMPTVEKSTNTETSTPDGLNPGKGGVAFSAPAEVGSRTDLQNSSPNRAMPKGASPDSQRPSGEKTDQTKGSQPEGSLQSKVQDLMTKYLNGAISQGELVRQLKMVNNVLAHNMVKEAKQALGGSAALATSPEHQSQLPQSRSLLDDSATNVKAAGIEETGPPPPENDESAYGSFGQDGVLSTEHEKQKDEQQQQQQESDQQMLDGVIADREVNEQVQVQRINQVVEQNARAAQDKQRQMQEQQKEQDAQTKDVAGQRGQIGEFMRTASKASAQKQKYLQRSKSRASVGNIPRIDTELSNGNQPKGQSLLQGTRDSSKGQGEIEEELAEVEVEVEVEADLVVEEEAEKLVEEPAAEEQSLPEWFKPIDDVKW
jgi:hypothetical protein